MPVLPRGDPRRPIELAVNAARVLGGIWLVLGAFGAVGSALAYGDGRVAGPIAGRALVAVVVQFVVPGGLYFFFAGLLKRHKDWAAIVLAVLAGIHCLVVGALMVAVVAWADWSDGWAEALGKVLTGGVFLAVGVLLIAYLLKSVAFIHSARGLHGPDARPYGARPANPERWAGYGVKREPPQAENAGRGGGPRQPGRHGPVRRDDRQGEGGGPDSGDIREEPSTSGPS